MGNKSARSHRKWLIRALGTFRCGELDSPSVHRNPPSRFAVPQRGTRLIDDAREAQTQLMQRKVFALRRPIVALHFPT
jgi:hypothetical protein